MRQFLTLLFAITLSICYGQTTNRHLFQIFEGNKTGFIDTTGQVVIKPTFRTVGEFSEGLAAARINGTYGYIDYTGAFVIQPQFDYATPFSDAFAIVYKEGKPFYINKTGQKVFDCNFPMVGQFENGRAIIITSTKKFGVINKQGQLIIDTVYSQLSPVADGMMIVHGLNHHAYDDEEKGIKKNYEIGVIDTLGNFIISYGKFKDIADYYNGYFKAEIPKEPWDSIYGYSAQTAIIDKTGKIIISKDYNNHCYIEGNLHCGLAKMHLYKYWIPEEKGVFSTTEKSYQGYINFKGKISINDTTFETAENFSENRAFVRDNDWHYSIINTQGKFVARNAYNRIIGDGFKNGFAFVAVDWKWGLIDTNANYIIKPQFDGIDEIGLIDDYFFFEEHNPDNKSDYENLIGLARTDGSILLKAIMQEFDRNGFKNGLLKCIIDGKLSYIDKSGKIVWQEKSNETTQVSNLNIDYMNRGDFYANSLPNKKEHSGGWAESKNSPKKISKASGYPVNTLSIVVKPNADDTFSKTYNALTVYVANNTKSKIVFNAQNSRLYMKVQALNKKGEWVDIEYLPNSWCGNSYHTLTLESEYYWTFLTPIYEGDFKTKFRIELKYIDTTDKSVKQWDKKEITIYSNEYEGSINPGQFWRKNDYYPNGIMDPYND